MKKFTLFILATLLSVVSYAQKPVAVAPVKDFTATVSATSQASFTKQGAVSSSRAKKAPSKVQGDPNSIITELPASAVVKTYERSGYYHRYYNSAYSVAEQSGFATIAFDGNDVYFLDPIAGVGFDTYVKGTLEGNTITVPLGQFLNYAAAYGYGLYLTMADVTSAFSGTNDVAATEITYTIDGDRIIQNGTSATRTLTLAWSDDNTVYQYGAPGGEYETVFETSSLPDVVTLPEGLTTTELPLTGRNSYSNQWHDVESTVNIAFDGDEVYIQGLSTLLPEAWVKGKSVDGKLVFPNGQYLGQYGSNALYAVGYDSSTGSVADFTFTERAENLYILDNLLFENAKTDAISYFRYWANGLTLGTEEELELVTLPDGLTPVAYPFTGTYTAGDDDTDFSQTVNVAVDGNDVYFQGFNNYVPTAWVKGTKSADGKTVTLPIPQNLGIYRDTYQFYLVGVDPETEELQDVVLSYDAKNDAYTLQNDLLLNGERYGIYYYRWYYAGALIGEITPVEPVEDGVYTFDFNALDPATTPTSNNGNEGDITEDTEIVEQGVVLTVSPSTTNTPNRFWKDNSAGIQLRVYGGTLTFEVPEGSSDITKIVFNNGRWNAGNAADSGELDANATWTGSAQKVVVSIAGNTQLNSIAVTVGEEEPFNIVELIKITPEEGEVESLQNFQITFGDYAVTVNEDAVPTLTNTDTEAVLDGGIGLSDDGKTVFVDFDSEATEAGTYRLDIPENSIYYEGVALDPLVFTYTVKGEEAPEYTIDPEEGEVESLSAFTITFNKYLVDADSDVAVAFLINTDTEEEVAGTVYAIAGGRQAYISLEREVTEAGEYELIVADGALQKTIDDSFLPELSFSYTIVAAPITLDFNLVEVPEDAVVEEYLFSAYDPYYEEVVTRNIQVATSGNDVYFNGVTEILPEGWIKGVRTGNTVTFDAAQYLGVYYYYGIYPYHFWFNADGKVTFQYDEAKDEYTTAYYTTLMYDEDDEEDPYYIYDEYEDIVITRIIEVAATPADPEITSVESTTYGDVLEFNIPVEDVDGNPLIASNLFYQVFSDVERVVTPVTFTPDYFEYLTDDLTEIPYGFTENWDFYNGTIYLNLDHDDWNKVGLQSIYYGGGEVNKSNIVWYDIKDYTTDGITGVNAADEANAKYFDLQGRQVKADTKGVIIRQVVDANGKVSVSKIVRK